MFEQSRVVHPPPFTYTVAPLPSAAVRRDSARQCALKCVAPGGSWGIFFQVGNDWTVCVYVSSKMSYV